MATFDLPFFSEIKSGGGGGEEKVSIKTVTTAVVPTANMLANSIHTSTKIELKSV